MEKLKVKIAVAIDKNGRWSSAGWGSKVDGAKIDDLMSYAIENLENGEKQYVIEVELEIPMQEIIVADALPV